MANITGNDLPNLLLGTNESDLIRGLGGNDILLGNGGDDNLDGGTGIDTMLGGAGNDYYYVDDNRDVITELGNDPGDFVISSISFNMNAYPGIPAGAPNIENLFLFGEASIFAFGNSLNNRMTGNSGNNELYGKEGDDTLDGREGNDYLSGELGDDTYIISDSFDTVSEAINEGNDIVNASVSYTLTANVERLTLTGTDNINGTGNDLDNLLIGNAGVNTLDGGKGNDILLGGAAKDILKGGTGADRFVFGSPTDGVDRIVDFSRKEKDKLVFVSNGPDSFEGLRLGRVKKGQFVVGKKAQDKNDRFIYNEDKGILSYDRDGKGGVGQVRIATVASQSALGAKDLLVVATPF